MRHVFLPLGIFFLFALSACSRTPDDSAARRYELTGQVVAADPGRRELTIAHDDIRGYMRGMVMPFRLADDAPWQDLKPGDLVRGQLVVGSEDGFVTGLEVTGHRAIAAPPAATGAAEEFLLEGDVLPDATFVDQEGQPRQLRQAAGSAAVLTFIYTRCPFPTFCPLMDRHFKTLQDRIAADARLAGRVRLLSITLDPEYDTPAVLKAHAVRLQADGRSWAFLRPHDAAASELPRLFGVTGSRDPADSAMIVHSLATVVIDPAGKVAQIYRGNTWTPADIMARLQSVISTAPAEAS
jgi:protein SCO1/2